ncbi:hypothetical protein NQ315_002498 [Exocentrus adspersus]|uniref:DUS-like FMN-binding domain-containing protein n=1 Tax=Exocentrus adspersus TaxID=1586481 RepID=A0AAV8VL84_9CUCU|nr:hypothetical protein NQ315_002498 [Exocentrus adspersus]
MPEKDNSLNILHLFEEKKLVKICAPMVRYSKLQFRNLVKLYDCDLAFTPMILADSFCQSEKARRNEFTTNFLDTPLITQFAANSVPDFVGAAYLSSPYCNGVDLNCGCPQKWAKDLELGCVMLNKPELIYDIVRQCRNRILKPFTVSVKMRLLNDMTETVNFCKQLELCGVSFLSVHARTSNQFSGNINKQALKLIKENCNIPIIANGGITSLEDCFLLQAETNCDGVMAANGLLTNPTLFSGSNATTKGCIQNWLNICYNSTLSLENYDSIISDVKPEIPEKPYNLTFQCFHHHLVFMLEKILPGKKKKIFNNLKTFEAVLDFIEHNFELIPQRYDRMQFLNTLGLDLDFLGRDKEYKKLKLSNIDKMKIKNYDYLDDGKYYHNKISCMEETECDWSNIFLENT